MYKKIYNSPLGKIYMVSDGEYLTGLWFDDSKDAFRQKSDYKEKELPIFDETIHWLDIYFQGKNPDFIPKYKMIGITPFRQEVVDIMNQIPYGKTISYNDISKEVAKKRNIKRMSSQAVGQAVGWNPICLIIPCHRVIGANGNLTGYGGGIQNKISLLKLEGNDINNFSIPSKKDK